MSNVQQYAHAQDFSIDQLPVPGTMVGVSSPFAPLALKGLVVNLNEPLEFQFIVDTGKGAQDIASIKEETNQLVKYFLAGITIPGRDLWVNLSPYEKDRIAPSALGETDLGRDLLAQDYILKQLIASLINPEKDLGREFWQKVYAKAQAKYGTTNIPINTFNKVWILPDEAQVFEKNNAAYVTKSTLKVMLDEDYLAKQKHQETKASGISSQIVRELILPEIEKEVNTGKNFALLRQIYQALILAKWYKETIENGLMDALYTNKKMVKGVNVNDPAVKEEIYQRYLKAYKKGAFNFIKEDYDPATQESVPRKYFSGGITQMGTFPLEKTHDDAMLSDIQPQGKLIGVTVDCGIERNHHPQAKPAKVVEETTSAVKMENVEIPVAVKQQPIQPAPTLGPSNSFIAEVKEGFRKTYDQAMVVLWAVVAAVGYFIYKFISKKIEKAKENRQDAPLVHVAVQAVPALPMRQGQRGIVPQNPRTQIAAQVRRPNNQQNPQNDSGLPADLRIELNNQIQQLGNSVAENSKMALIRSFRPTGPGELPLPIPITILNQDASDRDKVIHILENMQRMMDGTDEKVLRDFERAIDNARDRVTQQALQRFDNLSDEETVRLLTSGYIQELQREFELIFEEQVQHMVRFYMPSYQEQSLYVSDEINERYPRLPRYLKWILTNNPDLENDFYVRQWLDMIQNRVNQIPAFPDMITGYSKVALTKSLYLNPELARKVLLFLTRYASSRNGNANDVDVTRGIQQELARTITDDNFIEGEVIPDEPAGFPAALEAPSQVLSLPAPDASVDDKKAQLRALLDDYTQFMTKYREQQEAINKAQADLRELNDSLEEAKRTNDRVIIAALQTAVEGLASKLRKLNEKMPRLDQDKTRYEQRISTLRNELGPAGTNLYSIDPISLGVAVVFTVMFGIPLYVTKTILNKWYNTTAGKTLGMGASIGALAAGYYLYLGSLSPEIEKFIHDPSNPNPTLATFFIIWPIAILSGIYGGKVGKGWSHTRLYWKANSAFQKNDYREALGIIEQALKLKPKNADDFTLKAEILRKLQRFPEAISAYKKALGIEPNNSTFQNNLGVVYDEAGIPKEAIQYYKKAAELEPNDPVFFSNLGRSLHREGQLIDAARYFQRAQEIKPDPEITQELNQILQQTGRLEKFKPAEHLPFFKTMWQVVPSSSQWIKTFYGEFEEIGGGLAFVGALLGGGFVWLASSQGWWQMGTEHVTTATQVKVWAGALGGGVFLTMGAAFVVGKIYDLFVTIFRFFGFPGNFKKIQDVNIKPSDQLSDKELAEAAPMYARMSKSHLGEIFKSWLETGQEEKIERLLKFGEWDSDKTGIYHTLAEYKKVRRAAAVKFAVNVEGQQEVFAFIDKQKDALTAKGIANAISLIKDILPTITEASSDYQQFQHWLTVVVDLPINVLKSGNRHILSAFNDLRELDKATEDAKEKFRPLVKRKYVVLDVERLEKKMKDDGLNYPGILAKILAEITKISENYDEFSFWVNAILQFDKQILSSGRYMAHLQNLIAYETAKKEAAAKFTRTAEEKKRLYEAVDGLRDELLRKQIITDVSVLNDVIPSVTRTSTTLNDFFRWINHIKTFDKNIWSNPRTVLTTLSFQVDYEIAKLEAARKFSINETDRPRFLADIDAQRSKLIEKGIAQPSEMLKAVLPELTKTCRTKDEFMYWLGELIGLNVSVWRQGAQTIINNFNDLAGYKLAKEAAVGKLASTARDKVDLTKSIDDLKSSLESKLPASAGYMKDIILEILKDIDVLAQPPHRRNDFLWYLGKVVNFDTPNWSGGSAQVIAGYQEIKRYIVNKRAYFAKFAPAGEDHQRLLKAYENLDKSPNFSRPSFIVLLNDALEKIAQNVSTPRDFIFWVGTLSEFNGDVLESFLRDIDTVLAYWHQKGKSNDFNKLPAVLNRHYKAEHQTALITPAILDIITDATLDTDQRVEKLSKYLIQQKIVTLGAPQNLVGLRDAFSFDELIDAIARKNKKEGESASGEDTLRSFMRTHQPLKIAISKMGRDGIYSYAESQKPKYYVDFLAEAKGLRPGFNQPGEKFQVSYLDRKSNLSKQEESQLIPITSNIEALKQLIKYLRAEWPNFYENFYDAKREFFKGRPMEDFVTSDSVNIMAKALLGKILNWPLTEQQRIIFVSKIMEIYAFGEVTDLRTRIVSSTSEFARFRLIAQYWEKLLALTIDEKWLQANSKYYKEFLKTTKSKLSIINEKIGSGGDGILQFFLSGGTLADFFKGWVSEDCTRSDSGEYPHFLDTQAWVMDPGAFLFKVVEHNKWVGNIYTFAFKGKDGKFYLYWDMFQLNLQHPITKSSSDWNERRIKFSSDVIRQMTEWLGSIGFDYLIISSSPAQHKIGSDIITAIKMDYGIDQTTSVDLKKLGGTEFFADAGVHEEYVQTLSGNHISSGFQSVTGYKIRIDKTTAQALQVKQTDLDYLEKLLGEMSSEESRLSRLKKEKDEELKQINQKGYEAAVAGRNAVALALKEASQAKMTEIQRIEYELNALRVTMPEKKDEYNHLAVELGLSPSADMAMSVQRVAAGQGFDEVLMSSFVSNFNAIHDHFAAKYETTPQEIRKVGGFEHLVSLGLWGNHATRNEYLETYSPHWNFPLRRIDPNNPKQTLLLRTIWKSAIIKLDEELDSGRPSNPDMAMTTAAKKPVSKLRRTLQKVALGVALTIPLMMATTGRAQAEVITHNTDGTLHVAIEQNDTFGQILLDAGYRGELWGTKGIVAQLQGGVEKQIPSHNIGIIVPGTQFNMPDPIVFDSEVRGYMQQLSHAIGHLKTVSRIFSDEKLEDLDQLLSNIPQKVSGNEYANSIVQEIKQARADMDSTLFRVNPMKIVGDVHKHFKAAEIMMKPFMTKKAFSLNLQGNIHLGPLTIHLPGVAIGKRHPSVGISGDISEGHGTQEVGADAQKTIDQLNTQLQAVQAELDSLRQNHSNLSIENTGLKAKLAQAQQQIDRLKSGSVVSDEITQLQNKKSDLERQLTALSMQQQQVKADLQRTQAEKEKVNGEINALHQQIPALQQQADSLKGQVADLNTEREQTQTQVTKLQTQKDTLQGSVTQLTHDRDGLQQQIDQLKGQLEQAKDQLKQADANSMPSFNNVWANLSSWEKIGIFLFSLTGIGAIIAGFMMWKKIKKYEELNGRVSDLQAQAQDLARQLEAMRQEKIALTQVIESKKAESSELDRQKQEKHAEVQVISEQIGQLKFEKQEIENQITAAKAERDRLINELEGKITDLKRQAQEKESEIATLTKVNFAPLEEAGEEQRITGIEPPSMTAAQQEEITALQNQIISLETTIADLNQEKTQTMSELEQELTELNGQNDALITRISELRGVLESGQQAISQQEKTSASLKEEIAVHQQILAGLKETLQNQTAGLTGQQQEIVNKQQEISTLQREAQGLRQDIGDLESQKINLTDTVGKKQQELEALEQRLREVQGALTSQTQTNAQALSQQQTDIQEKEAKKQSLQDEIGELDRKKQESLETLRKLDEERTKIKGEVDSLTAKRQSESTELEGLAARIADLGTQETTLKTSVDGLELTEQLLKDEVRALEEQVRQLTAKGQGQKQEIEVIEPKVEELVKEADELVKETMPKEIGPRIPPEDLKAVSDRFAVAPDSLIRHLTYALGRSALGQKIEGIYAEHATVDDWFKTQDFYRDFKQKATGIGLNSDFDRPGEVADFKIGNDAYSLELSDRGPEYLIRGLFSGDCTNPYFEDSSFQSATLRHLVMPSFLNFKVMRGKEWLGNIYAAVLEKNGKPILVIDAVQIPWLHEKGRGQPSGGYLPTHFSSMLFPVHSLKDSIIIGDGAIDGLKKYAERMGFNELWHSSFVSNFYDLKSNYSKKYQKVPTSRFDSLDMMIGYKSMQDALHLGGIYIESNGNPSAWIIWQGKTQPTVDLRRPPVTVVHTPEAFVDAVGKGEYLSPETKQLLAERFHIVSPWLADRLKQRMRESKDVRKVFEILGTGETISQWMRQNKRESGYGAFEDEIQRLGIDPEFDKPGLQIQMGEDSDHNAYKLVLSNRDADDIVRGYISGDCTNPGWQHADDTFSRYFPEHILKPGFLNFRIYRAAQHAPYEWVGNVYAAVIKQNGRSVLLIDAIQIPWNGMRANEGMEIFPLPGGANQTVRFSVGNLQEAEKISDRVIEALGTQYAGQYGFTKTYLGFGSNFTPLVEYFYERYAANYNRLLPPSENIVHGQGGAPDIAAPRVRKITDREYLSKLKSLRFDLVGLSEDKLDSFPNAPYARRGFADIGTSSAGSAKGKGMFSSGEHQNVNQVIASAQRERRGELIWGNASGWNDNRAKFAKGITWDIESLRKKYPSAKIPGLGKVDIAHVLVSSSIVLIIPPANGPPGLVSNNINSYQIAHNGLNQNTIYIDQYAFSQLHEFEVAILLGHESIQLGAKKLAAKKGVSWTEQLAREVTRISDEWESAIVGRSDKGRGSRFDERIEDILCFNKPKPEVREPRIIEIRPQPRRAPVQPERPQPKPFAEPPQPQPMQTPQESNGKFSLDFPDTKDSVIEGLQKLFLESMFKDTTGNLPVKWEAFPPPMAREIKKALDAGKIEKMTLNPTLLAALTLFFSRLFPNHASNLIEYLRTLRIYIIDNERSTFGATLEGDTFYIQRSLFDDLLKKRLTVDEIHQRMKNKDRETLVVLLRIIIHEIGAAFFKTSHEANQDMEQIFLGLLNRVNSTVPYKTREEFSRINAAVDLNSLPRQDWAIYYHDYLKGGIDLNHIKINRSGDIVKINFDPTEINVIKQGGFEGFTPVIINIVPIQNLLPVLGINAVKLPSSLAKDEEYPQSSKIMPPI